jgi:hypothetical protein
MKLIYEDVDITNSIDINKADFTDNAGGIADSLELWLNDTKGLWSQWKPQKNDKVKFIQDSLTTGTMYIDEIEQRKGMFILRALSIPQEAKSANTQAWESVRFLEFATEISSRHGFTLETYNVENYLYDRVDQCEQADFSFLALRCELEGYVLKISDNKAIIYDEAYLEGLETDKNIYINSFDGDYKFLSKSTGIYNSCNIVYNGINSSYRPPNALYGPTLNLKNVYISSLGEGNRFAKNLLRAQNKCENMGAFSLKFKADLTAGSNLNIIGIGLADGKYFCQQVKHNFAGGRTSFKVRRPLEGY